MSSKKTAIKTLVFVFESQLTTFVYAKQFEQLRFAHQQQINMKIDIFNDENLAIWFISTAPRIKLISNVCPTELAQKMEFGLSNHFQSMKFKQKAMGKFRTKLTVTVYMQSSL